MFDYSFKVCFCVVFVGVVGKTFFPDQRSLLFVIADVCWVHVLDFILVLYLQTVHNHINYNWIILLLQLSLHYAFCVTVTLQTEYMFGRINHDKLVFDPSFFTPTIKECQESCADKYFTCSFVTCSESSISKALTTAPPDPEYVCCMDVSPTFWSRFLYYFTLSILGQKDTRRHCLDECQYFGLARTVWLEPKEQKSNPYFVCLDKCTAYFHKCYKQCICADNADHVNCMPDPNIIYPQKQPILVKGDRWNPITLSTEKKSYAFDWGQFMTRP